MDNLFNAATSKLSCVIILSPITLNQVLESANVANYDDIANKVANNDGNIGIGKQVFYSGFIVNSDIANNDANRNIGLLPATSLPPTAFVGSVQHRGNWNDNSHVIVNTKVISTKNLPCRHLNAFYT